MFYLLIWVVDIQIQGGEKVGLQLWVHKTQSLFLYYYCIIFHKNIHKSTFAPSCVNHHENKLLLKLKKKQTHGTYQNLRKSVWPVSQDIVWWEMEWQHTTPKHKIVSSSVETTYPFACKRKEINKSKAVGAILLEFINSIIKTTEIYKYLFPQEYSQ